jgi:hypothetical protein
VNVRGRDGFKLPPDTARLVAKADLLVDGAGELAFGIALPSTWLFVTLSAMQSTFEDAFAVR